MKIISSTQLKELDKYTIVKEPIASIDLMERAAEELTHAIMRRWNTSFHIVVFAGPGNNGGDALAVARMLSLQNYHVEVFLFNTQGELSEECNTNLERLRGYDSVHLTEVSTRFDPPVLTERHLVVDGLFGSGLNKPLNGGFAAVVKYINASKAQVVSIDIPSGLMCEDNTYNLRQNMIHANVTLSIQLPKLSFFFPENEDIVGEWQLLDIQLRKDFIDMADSPYYITEEAEIRHLIKPRKRFAHKGNFGHALLIAGSYGMAGSSILSARACLRSGVGLLTVHTPIHNHDLLQATVPEAIVQTDIHEHYFAEPVDTDSYHAIAIGPGLGQEEDTALAMIEQIQNSQLPVVLDADAINILGTHRNWFSRIPKYSILTPHLKELERLIGKCMDTYERLTKTKELATYLQSYIIIKGAWSIVVTPEGNCYFNPTGNPGMATAGSGDILTGILAALLAQGYNQEEACRLGVYVHGLAGDIATAEKGEIGLTASDIVDALPAAWKKLAAR
ncbi:MAG: NAD(P)H-hydrate dehydratase [Phocaeicola sp.]|uniref:NAD(P)H-hydrate dehydratase n=1 Tax=Phocaeicola sp. TaxID=2773926 RepID=UPI0023CBB7F8|nr:NAD(P)H-hydrate dehydratase [Phocaeicola sp.]MDE5676994.1 NAD(P)H-hydrate dehydratase [Phocaeicola sp.]MDE6180846.1 NAD(P)H-hydrate dehydratase [Phocaeicola sp.]